MEASEFSIDQGLINLGNVEPRIDQGLINPGNVEPLEGSFTLPCGHSLSVSTFNNAIPKSDYRCPLDRIPIVKEVVHNIAFSNITGPVVSAVPSPDVIRLFEEGKVSADKGDYSAAAELFIKVIDLAPSFEMAKNFLNFCLNQKTHPSLLERGRLYKRNNDFDALEHASKEGKLEEVDDRIGEGASLDPSHHNRATDIHAAAVGRHVEKMGFLYQMDPSLLNDWTPLHNAAFHGQIRAMEWLYNNNPSPFFLHRSTVDGVTPLHAAAEGGNVEAMKWLCRRDRNLLQKEDAFKRTSMHFAAYGGHKEAIRWLNQQNSSFLYQEDANGLIPLHYAVSNDQLEATQCLCEIDPSLLQKVTKEGLTLFQLASSGGRIEKWLRQQLEEEAERERRKYF